MIRPGFTRAHTNIALIKYWGKENDELIIPLNSSLSLTLEAFYTETKVDFDSSLDRDYLILDDQEEDAGSLKKAQVILDLVRQEAGIQDHAKITSYNHVPTAAGLASSASGMAALAGAASKAAGLDLSMQDLSRLARRGSGSASRSIYGGLVEWQKGHSDETSYAVPVDDADFDIGMLFIILNKKRKAISSRAGMKRTVETSPYIKAWAETAETDLKAMKAAIKRQDLEEMGLITERSAYKMHATTMGAIEPFMYMQPESLEAIQLVKAMRDKGYACYFTMDAGPNVKVLCRQSQMADLAKEFQAVFGQDKILSSTVGPGIQL